MQVTFETYLIVLPLVFLAAVVDAIGGGGGLISLPAYQLAGLPYDIASGTNKFSAMFGSLTATVKYARSGRVLWKEGLLAAACAIPASWLGASVVSSLAENIKQLFMLIAVPVMAVLLLTRKFKADEPAVKSKPKLVLCALTGLVVGFYDGFFGPGTGTLLIIFLSLWAGMDYVSASGTAKLINLSSNCAALVKWITNGTVLYALALPAMVCSIIGGYVGSKLALTKGAGIIRYVMIGVLALLVIKMALSFFGIL